MIELWKRVFRKPTKWQHVVGYVILVGGLALAVGSLSGCDQTWAPDHVVPLEDIPRHMPDGVDVQIASIKLIEYRTLERVRSHCESLGTVHRVGGCHYRLDGSDFHYIVRMSVDGYALEHEVGHVWHGEYHE